MTEMYLRFALTAQFKTLIFSQLVFSGLVLIGCGRVQETESPAVSAMEASISEQITLGRSGGSDRIELVETTIDDLDLEPLGEQDVWVETMVLDQGAVSDAGINAISRLPSLRHLRLRKSPIGDRGFEQLSQCQSIQILNVPQCEATDKGVAVLANLQDLRNLRIGGQNLGKETAESIALIKSLRNVHLIGVPIDDQGLREIVSLPKLQSLYLDDSAITPVGWDWLFETHGDLHIHVDQKHMDRDPSNHQH